MTEPQNVAAGEKHYVAKVIERKDLSEDLWLVRVDPGGPFSFKAGQYATLGVDHEGKRIERAYSIVSSPYEEGLEFFIELVPQGELTPHLYKLHPGDTLLCRKISKGRFTLDLKSGRTNHLLLATVTGLAPFVSYVRTLYKDWKAGNSPMPGNHKLFCIQGGSRSWEFGYREEMEKFAAEVPWFKYVSTISRPWEDEKWSGQTGRVDDLVRQYATEWGLKPAETTGYLCGHPNMVENCRGILQRAGWQKGSMFEEVYFQPAKED
ncbi:MAG TPA: ferredoxin--NADP reductase [Candidatus Acidoferrum sp.]|jgi:ferredoxin/flavodoxin---NADP+ reductase|nr:ferredoxin--NADP reductase [Candidatus Acidoferrum sp.]